MTEAVETTKETKKKHTEPIVGATGKDVQKPTLSIKNWIGETVNVKTDTETITANLEAIESAGVVLGFAKYVRFIPWHQIKDVRK